jgi:hypothetical protein
MALANVAWILASAGNRVLTIDWDLEAPGLHRYFQPFLIDKELVGQESQGLIDMVLAYAARAATPLSGGELQDERWLEAQADFSKWRQKLRWPSGEAVRLGKQGRGEIDFVPSGRQDANYAKRVNHFDWHSFYERLSGGAYFDQARKKLSAYDYVLIDSRTGVSDTSGICTVQMPDTLVVCFTLNYQSIKGALAVSQSVKALRPEMRIFPLPTRIDGSEKRLLDRMKGYASKAFAPLLDSKLDPTKYWFSMEVPYFARYAYAEKLALFEPQSSISASTLPAMERLTDYLTDGVVQSAGRLPEEERSAALSQYEEGEELTAVVADRSPAAGEMRAEKSSPAATVLSDYPPLGIFISHRREDLDIAVAIRASLFQLSALVQNHIRVFFDQEAIETGTLFRESIQRALEQTNFLLVIGQDTSTSSYTGFEVGYFSRLAADESQRRRSSERRIVELYFGSASAFVSQFAGINIGIDPKDLSGSRTDYVEKLKEGQDSLVNFFLDIGQRAESRLPPGIIEPDEARRRRGELISDEIVPNLRGQLFNLMNSRVRARTDWRRRLEFDLPPGELPRLSIPDNTRLLARGKVFEIFGVSLLDEQTTWEEFKSLAERQVRGASWLSVVEQTVITATSPVAQTGGRDTILSYDQKVFRVIATEKTDYYNGRQIIEINFIQTGQRLSDRGDASAVASFLSLAMRRKALLDRSSSFSVESFLLAKDHIQAQEMVRQFMSELQNIENDTVQSGVTGVGEIGRYLGDEFLRDRSNRSKFLSVFDQWNAIRSRLGNCADQVLRLSPGSPDFDVVYQNFCDALDNLRIGSDAFNSTVVHVLENVAKTFAGKPSFSAS